MTTPKAVNIAGARPDDAAGASPLGEARHAVAQLLTDLEATLAQIHRRLSEVDAEAARSRDGLEEAEVLRRHVMRFLHRLQPAEVEAAFQRWGEMRAALALAEERSQELGARREATWAHVNALRRVQVGLDDFAQLEGTGAAEGAARFRSASRQVFRIVEEERMRIARDLHDGPAQTMANLVLQAEVLERLGDRDRQLVRDGLLEFKNGVRGALEETRRLILDLRPMTLDELGLVTTLRRYVREFSEKSGTAARLHLVGEERRLSPNLEAVLFRIVQEALTNARRHSGARSVEVVVTFQPGRVSALVRDDGEGFDVAATEARQGRTRHLGLISMRERAELEHGSLEVRSEVGRGTEVRVGFDA